jgi:putative acetyltransferase
VILVRPFSEADAEALAVILFSAVRQVGAQHYSQAQVETLARGEGLRRLHVEASEPARRFFERRGFATLGRREFAIRGVTIHNYRMEKRLPD